MTQWQLLVRDGRIVQRKTRTPPSDPNSPETFRRMRPEGRVALAVEMSSAVSTITQESILDRNPGISRSRLLAEARKRFGLGRRTR